MGLDRDDTVVRRRLRQKLEFIADEVIDSTPPTESEVRAWLDAHPDAFGGEPQLSFRQVYVRTDLGARDARAEAERLLERLRVAGPQVAADRLGDVSMLPPRCRSGRSAR